MAARQPRITCNAYLTTQRKAWDVLSDFCSAMRCMPVWERQTLMLGRTDRRLDKVWTYNRSNVVMPELRRAVPLQLQRPEGPPYAVEVNWIDPDNCWERTELVEDQVIARYGRRRHQDGCLWLYQP
ncbi:phage tail protein [Escherichia coli]